MTRGGWLQFLGASDEAHWHRIDADVTYTLKRGGPLSISVSCDGISASGHRLVARNDSLVVTGNAIRALSCLGAEALFQVDVPPGFSVSDRQLMPDNWYPKG